MRSHRKTPHIVIVETPNNPVVHHWHCKLGSQSWSDIPPKVNGTGAILAANHSGVEKWGLIIRTDNYALVDLHTSTWVGIDMHMMDLTDTHTVLFGCFGWFRYDNTQHYRSLGACLYNCILFRSVGATLHWQGLTSLKQVYAVALR